MARGGLQAILETVQNGRHPSAPARTSPARPFFVLDV